MPELLLSLLKQDIGHLRIVAEFWGIELESIAVDEAREELSASLLDAELIAELIDSLSPQAKSAVHALVDAGGRIPWAVFTRQYGDIREMGAARRDRERLQLVREYSEIFNIIAKKPLLPYYHAVAADFFKWLDGVAQ